MKSYKYLGRTVKMEVLIRIKTGWNCFGRYKDILVIRNNNNNNNNNTEKRVFNQLVCYTSNDIWLLNLENKNVPRSKTGNNTA